MTTYLAEPDHGCGFMGGIFQRRGIWPRKSSFPSLTSRSHTKDSPKKVIVTNNEKEEQKNSVEFAKEGREKLRTQNSKLMSPRVSISQQGKRVSDVARSSNVTTTTTTSSSSSSSSSSTTNLALIKVNRIPERQSSGEQSDNIANELNKVSSSNPQNYGNLRASSGNILQFSQKNSLKQNGYENSPMKYNPNHMISKNFESNVTMGNILRRSSDEVRLQGQMNKLDPEELKAMGNEKYKQGKFEFALALYDQAVALDSNMAAYRSNKSAALTALGRFLDAVVECKEAVRIDPLYQRAHHRLATLYFRLGYADDALKHFNLSGSIANFIDYNQAKALKTSLSECTRAKEHKDWTTLLKQTQKALALGADSALQIYALQAQALLNLQMHDEAYAAFKQGPCFNMDSYTRLFGQARSTHILLIQAQVYLATGRFEEAITTAQKAAQLDSTDKDIRKTVIKTQTVSLVRSKGNMLFKDLKFSEACNVYSEGLEYDPYNSVLLCNRAACRFKLGQFEKALEDCTLALNLQPSYSKARLRRAHCNAKLERWEASIQDYEILISEKPGDEEVGRALFEAKIQLKIQCGEDVKDLKFGRDVTFVTSIECFRNLITSPGMSVVLFCNKSNQEKALPLLEQVCFRFPSINFLKVEVEDHPYLAKSEEVSYLPAFKIYKNGSRVKDIPGNNLGSLESSVKLLSG